MAIFTVAHRKGTDKGFIAVEGVFAVIETTYDLNNAFWKAAHDQNLISADVDPRQLKELDWFTIVNVRTTGDIAKDATTAISIAQDNYMQSSVRKRYLAEEPVATAQI